MARTTTRNGTGRRLQRKQNEQSTSTSSSTTENQANVNLTDTARPKRGLKAKSLIEQTLGTGSRTTRNSTGRRLQREQNEQSTSTSSSTTENQANANLTDTARPKRGLKTKILTEQAIGTVGIGSSSSSTQRKLKNTSLGQLVGTETETPEQVAAVVENMSDDTHMSSNGQSQLSQPVASIPKHRKKPINTTARIKKAVTTNAPATSKRVPKRKAVTEGSTTAGQEASDDPRVDEGESEGKPHKRGRTNSSEQESTEPIETPITTGNLFRQESTEHIVPDAATAGEATNNSVKKRKKTSEKGEEEDDRNSKKAKNPEIPEKRLSRFRKRCPPPISERIYRAETQRLYMVNRKVVGAYRQEFAILGSTGNVYTVTIAHEPNCICPDFRKGYLCKHIIFIYLRVLRLDRNSSLIYQKALLTEELHSIFANAAPDPTILANQYVRDKYKTITSGEASESAASGDERRRPIEGDCPICYEPLEEKDRKNIVWCKGSCGNNLHNDCLEQWKKSKHGGKVTCVYCRSDWVSDGEVLLNDEGYLNLGNAQGMNTVRDTSSYYRNYRTARNSWY